MTSLRLTARDLELFPLEDGTRYEIIDGELYVTTQPSVEHQIVCHRYGVLLESAAGEAGVVIPAPRVILSEDQAVAPDVVWVSRGRLRDLVGPDRKLHAAPDLVIEVLSPGAENERRDREIKLALYSRRGVQEYWITDWVARRVDVYRRENAALRLLATLLEDDVLDSPLLPGFACPLASLFAGLPLEDTASQR